MFLALSIFFLWRPTQWLLVDSWEYGQQSLNVCFDYVSLSLANSQGYMLKRVQCSFILHAPMMGLFIENVSFPPIENVRIHTYTVHKLSNGTTGGGITLQQRGLWKIALYQTLQCLEDYCKYTELESIINTFARDHKPYLRMYAAFLMSKPTLNGQFFDWSLVWLSLRWTVRIRNRSRHTFLNIRRLYNV